MNLDGREGDGGAPVSLLREPVKVGLLTSLSWNEEPRMLAIRTLNILRVTQTGGTSRRLDVNGQVVEKELQPWPTSPCTRGRNNALLRTLDVRQIRKTVSGEASGM